MNLHLDDTLWRRDPEECDLEAALARLSRRGGALELRGDGERCLRARRGTCGWFLEFQPRRNVLLGQSVGEAEAGAALRGFLGSGAMPGPWRAAAEGGPLADVVFGEAFEDGRSLRRSAELQRFRLVDSDAARVAPPRGEHG